MPQATLGPRTHRSEVTGELDHAVEQAGRIVLGKPRAIRLCLAGLLARGHVLIEDIPGVGKTTLALTLSRILGLTYRRIQFTSDMLPADILGASVFHRQNDEFRFHPGPIFAQVVLADEVNRATPKTQSALLEAMEEQQVTTEDETRPLPAPFFVIATQNPSHQIGTFPLPESQLDRFLLTVQIGYPDDAAERELLKGRDRREMLGDLAPVLTPDRLLELQRQVTDIHVSDALLDYLQALIRHTRQSGDFDAGLSPRAGLALKRTAQAWALMAGRNGVLPEDVQAILPGVIHHRLHLAPDSERTPHAEIGDRLLEAVPIP